MITANTSCRCFHCDKSITPSCVGIDPWQVPSRAVLLEGGDNFGSSVYDAGIDGVYCEVIICDDCLNNAKGTDRLREYKIETTLSRKIVMSGFRN